MKEAISLCSNLFIMFFSNLNKELHNFFENNGSMESRHKDPTNKNKNNLYKIPRLGR
jgi:hypothetical protein